MSFLSEIEKVRENTFITSMVGLLLLFSPGLMTIFYFQRDLFITLDFFKLLFLSLSYIVPFFIINLFLNFIFLESTMSKEEKADIEKEKQFWFVGSMMSLMFTGFIFYFSLVWSFLSKLTIDAMILRLCIFELVLIIATILAIMGKKKGVAI